jgi:hypothetical protein
MHQDIKILLKARRKLSNVLNLLKDVLDLRSVRDKIQWCHREIDGKLKTIAPQGTKKKPKILSRTQGLRRECDALWSELVKLRAGYRSEHSGKEGALQSHHILGKPNFKYRYCPENGYCLLRNEHLRQLCGIHNEGYREKYVTRLKEVRGQDVFERIKALCSGNERVGLPLIKVILKEQIKTIKKNQEG